MVNIQRHLASAASDVMGNECAGIVRLERREGDRDGGRSGGGGGRGLENLETGSNITKLESEGNKRMSDRE